MATATSVNQEFQVEMKLEVPELAANEQVLAMEQGEEEENSFLVADNEQMPQNRAEDQDKSIWRDLKHFLPVGDPAKMDEIKSLYGVSRAHDAGRRNNFIYLPCRFSQRKYKCSYIVRWGKADGMVQAKGEHKHTEFYLPKTLLINYDEQEQDKSVWRDLRQFLPVGDPAKMDEIKSLYRVSRASDKGGRCKFIYLQCSSTRKYKCKYIIRWVKADGMVQAKGEHKHMEFNLAKKPRHAGRQLEDEEEAAADNLDDLREIFASAIADELIREGRQREAAAAAKAAALACSSGRVHQQLNNQPPLLNPVIGSERVDQNCWEPRYEGHDLAAQNDGHGNEWQYEGEESAEEVDQADHNGFCESPRKHSGFQHIFNSYFL